MNYIRHCILENDEKGSTVLEYVLILPFILLVLMLIVLLIFISYDKAVLAGASDRGAIHARKMIEDPQYEKFVSNKIGGYTLDIDGSGGYITADNFNQLHPYRYFFMDGSEIERKTKEHVEKIMTSTSLFTSDVGNVDSTSKVTVEVKNYVVYTGVEVICEKKYHFPMNLMGLELGDFAFSARSYSVVNDTDEFIRNVDLATEIFEGVGILGDEGKATQMFDKVRNMFDKFF